MQYALLSDIIYIMILAAATLFVCNRIRVPSTVGFLLVGVMAGPLGLGLVRPTTEVETIAQIGVIMLLFTIGIEFSMEALLKIKKLMLLGGILQAAGTLLGAAAVLGFAGIGVRQAVFAGMLITLSSTAIVIRALQRRGEIDTLHGRTALGILIFQDLLAVPMILLIPVLAGAPDVKSSVLIAVVLKAILVFGLIAISEKWVLPGVFHRIARTRDTDLFLISIILLCFGIAYLTYSIGLSLALGAFLAGLMLSASQYGQRALSSILPLRDVFMSFFFVSIGMLLDTETIMSHPALVVGGTACLIMGKFLVAGIATILLGLPLRSAVLASLTIAQIGEFSFVVADVGLKAGLVSAGFFQLFLGISILSMIATPLLMAIGQRSADLLLRLPLPKRIRLGLLAEEPQARLSDHLVVIGFGLGGRHIVQAAESANIPHVIIEANPDTVRTERMAGRRIYHGDATAPSMLEHAGIQDARVAVIAISDPAGTKRVVQQTRQLNPAIHIIVRSRYFAETELLRSLGANEVVSEEYESSIEMFTRVLHKYLVPKEEIEDLVADIRAGAYQMLRSESPARADIQDIDLFLSDMDIRTIRVEERSGAVGRTLAELNLRKDYGITVLAVSRGGKKMTFPDSGLTFAVGDSVVLLGLPELLLFADAIFKAPDHQEPSAG